jgi:glycosyltransferase involved in cell wall biosynthesis
MKIRILMITYNRPTYTNLSLKTLLENTPDHAQIVVWDNASDEETRSVIRKYESHPRIDRIIFNPTNEKLRGPTNWFFENYRHADFLGKVDDDCLVPARWCENLQHAHLDIPEAGILGCWHYLPEDFNEETARKKIFRYGRHRIMRNCWVGGSGYLMKQSVLDEIGLIGEKESFTGYCIRAAAKGFVNGWYYPFLFQEHMDDPRTKHTGIRTDEDFKRLIPLSARTFNIDSRDAWICGLRLNAQRLQAYSFDPSDFSGLRARLKRRLYKVLRREYLPLVSDELHTSGA